MKTNITSRNAFRAAGRRGVAVAAGLLVLAATGCDYVRGKGDTLSKTRTVGGFTEIETRGSATVYLTQGAAEPIRLEGQDNILDVFETFVHNDKLILRVKPGVVLGRHETVRVYVTNPTLRAVRVSGSSDVVGQGVWDVDDFHAEISGSGKLEMALRDAEDVDTDISGSGNIFLRGNSLTADVDVSGSGNVRAFDLTTNDANVRISGSGNCEMTVQQKLTARISGSGNVRYRGRPAVDSRVTGSGRVVTAEVG
ncbi:MAG: DUF2807 domain-containing protein [Cytophagales bacterium]|nr:DUF2807 domain-containing protein [Cytophagales bacterium]